MSTGIIEFTCWETDEPLEVQLEPEAITFIIAKGSDLKFIGTSSADDFKWTLRIDHANKGVQLFPETKGYYDIKIFENDKLVEDWYKYM